MPKFCSSLIKTLLFAVLLLLCRGPAISQAINADRIQQGEGPGVFRVATAALLLSGQTGGAINTAVTAMATERESDKYKILAVTEVDLSGLEPAIKSGPVAIEVFVYFLDAGGDVAAKTSQIFKLDLSAVSFPEAANGLKVILPVEVASGMYRIRSLVTLPGTDSFGLQSTTISLPTGTSANTQLASATLLEDASLWYLAVPIGGLASAELLQSWTAQNETLLLPAARPVVLGEGSLMGRAVAQGLPLTQSQIVVRIFRSDGITEADLSADIVQRTAMTGGNLESVLFSFQIPDLFPSRYTVGLFSGHLQPTATASSEFLVAEPDSSEAHLVWTRSNANLEAITRPPPPNQAGLGETKKQERKIDQTAAEIEMIYRGVITQLAAGNRSNGQDILRRFEIEALASKSPEAMIDLERKEAKALKSLAEGSWARLVPFAVVYAELIHGYDSRGLSTLAEHALSMSTRLAEPIARKAKKHADKEVAADVLVSVGGYAIVGHRSGVGEELLQSAIKLDPMNTAALLSLGALYEQKGRYQEAVEVLEALVEDSPGHREAQLRLAVNWHREGRLSPSEDLLRGLVSDSSKDWVGLVAIQELAKLYSSQNQTADAITLLEDAIVNWPDQPSLKIQLAWLLDTAEDAEAASGLIESLLTSSAAPSDSARYRYNHWYSYVFDASRQSLARIVERRAIELDQSQLDTERSTGP